MSWWENNRVVVCKQNKLSKEVIFTISFIYNINNNEPNLVQRLWNHNILAYTTIYRDLLYQKLLTNP